MLHGGITFPQDALDSRSVSKSIMVYEMAKTARILTEAAPVLIELLQEALASKDRHHYTTRLLKGRSRPSFVPLLGNASRGMYMNSGTVG